MPQFTSKVWTIAGEQQFDGYVTLLNPSIKVQSMNIGSTTVSAALVVTENGGIFEHRFSVSLQNPVNTDVELLADELIAGNFPDAVLQE